MSTATVIEAPLELEPVTADTFVADLDARSPEADARLAAFLRRVARLTSSADLRLMVAFAPASRPTAGAYAWFAGMITSWIAFAGLALFSEDILPSVWDWLQGLPLIAELLMWFLTFPWALALAVWESGWEDGTRTLVVLLIACAWTIVSIPRSSPRPRP